MDEQQNNAVLKESFFPRRGGRYATGLLALAGAVLVAVFPSSASSGAAAPGARVARSAEAAALTIVRSPLAKPPGGVSGCRDGWSMSRLDAGTVWVGDSATGRINVYGLDGKRLRVIDTRLGRDRLAGFALGPDGRLSVLEAARAPAQRLRAGSS